MDVFDAHCEHLLVRTYRELKSDAASLWKQLRHRQLAAPGPRVKPRLADLPDAYLRRFLAD